MSATPFEWQPVPVGIKSENPVRRPARSGDHSQVSPDSDAVKWLVVVATLVQTAVAVTQAWQPRQADGSVSPSVPMTRTLKLALVSSVLATLWVVAYHRMHERKRLGDWVFYAIRDEFERATPLRLLIILSAFVIPGLGCYAIVSILKVMAISDLSASRMFVYVVALVACIMSSFVAVAQIFDSQLNNFTLLLPAVFGVMAGLDAEKE